MHHQKWLWSVAVNLTVTSCLQLGTLITLVTPVKETLRLFPVGFSTDRGHGSMTWLRQPAAAKREMPNLPHPPSPIPLSLQSVSLALNPGWS